MTPLQLERLSAWRLYLCFACHIDMILDDLQYHTKRQLLHMPLSFAFLQYHAPKVYFSVPRNKGDFVICKNPSRFFSIITPKLSISQCHTQSIEIVFVAQHRLSRTTSIISKQCVRACLVMKRYHVLFPAWTGRVCCAIMVRTKLRKRHSWVLADENTDCTFRFAER